MPSAHLAFEADGRLRDRELQAALSAVTERLLEEAGLAVGQVA